MCQSIGRDYIICEDLWSATARVKLRIRGVERCAHSNADIDAFFALLRYAGAQYTPDPEAAITLEGFIAATGIERALASRAFEYALLDGERFYRSGSAQQLTLDRFARLLRDVRSFDDLDARIQQFETINSSGVASAARQSVAELPGAAGGNASEARIEPDREKVFVVHGRDPDVRKSMFAFLRALRLTPIEWSEAVRMTGKGAPYIGEVLDFAFRHAQAVVVLLTPDDEVRLAPNLVQDTDDDNERAVRLQPRPNVLFEAGMAFGYQHDRTILVEVGSPKQFSDVHGRHTIRLDNSESRRRDLADRLETAGCSVQTSGHDWLKAGNFEIVRVASSVALFSATGDPESKQHLPRVKSPLATLSITSSATRIAPDRHDYILEVCAVNTGKAVLSNWTIQVKLPRAIVPQHESSAYRIDTGRDSRLATYRMTQEQHSGKPIFPGDDGLKVFNHHFAMNDALHDLGQQLLGVPVTATLFVGDEVVAEATMPFGDLQRY